MNRPISALVLLLAGLGAGVLLRPILFPGAPAPRGGATPAQIWTCGMHPQIRMSEPGSCPICGMALTPLAPSSSPSAAKGGKREIAYWWDPMMNPPYIKDGPGKSPMGMELVPRYKDEIAAGPGIEIDPRVVQNMGIRLAPVEAGPLEMSLRLFGSFRAAEPLEEEVTLKVGGFVERLFADTIGKSLAAGDPLFELYSPEILVAQEEILAARRALERRPSGGSEEARAESRELLDTAKRKLLLWNLDEEEIRRIESLPRADGLATLRSRAGGILVEKAVVRGSAVTAGMRVLRIADYSTVWLDSQAYEYQVPHLALGLAARARVESFPGEVFEGEVVFVSPSLDERSRTATVRLAFQNPDLRLRPGMYARVEIRAGLAEKALLVPREAILDTGVRQVAFVAVAGGKFESRVLRVGASGTDGMVQVLDGLAAGESVVVSGQFLLDSESRLREATRKFEEQRTPVEEGTRGEAGPHAATRPAGEVSETRPAESAPAPAPSTRPTAQPRVDAFVIPYLRLVDALAADRTDAGAVEAMRRAAKDLASDPSPEVAALGKALVDETAALANSADDSRRKRFAAVSETTVRLVEIVPPSNAVGSTLFVLHCPMFPGSWLQPSREVTNPLYGTAMLHCGEVRRAIVPGPGARPASAPAPHAGHEPR